MDLSSPPALVDVSDRFVQDLYAEGKVIDSLNRFTNESVILKSSRSSGLGWKKDDGYIHRLYEKSAFDVRGRNAEQRFALSALMDDDIPIVSLGGLAGTGKSVLALAAGLESVIEQQSFKRVVVFRPLYSVGNQELGYLPGDFSEKMNPWAQAAWDAIDSFCDDNTQNYIVDNDILEVLPLTHLRGRTLSDSFIIIDEAQNLDIGTIVTALTRVGEGSKVVLTHDVNQRDNASVGRADGILAVVERLLGHRLFAHVNLHKVERSEVAKVVSELFQDI